MGKKEEIGIRIRTMRKSRRMTQEDLARAIGQSASSITMYETGRRSPDYETLEALADVFNVPIASIVADNNEESSNDYRTPEIRIVSAMMERMSKEQQDQVVKMMQVMFINHPELLIREDEEK